MRNGNVVLAAALALSAGAAIGADASFENHLTSTPMVSPAQIYQVQEMKTDFAVGFSNSSDETKPDTGDKTTNELSGTNLFASGIYNIRSIGLRAGATVKYNSLSFESKTGSSTGKGDGTDMVFSPTVAMPVGPVVIGTAIDVHSRTFKPDGGDEAKSSHTQFRPAVMFADKDIEAGMAYETRRKSNPEKADEIAVSEPSALTMHGRYALDRDLALGGIIKSTNYQGLNDDAFKAQTSVKATGEFNAGDLKVEGDLGFNSAYHKEDKLMSEETISTIALGAAGDYSVTKQACVGAAFGYEFGSDENTDAKLKFAKNELTFLVRGDMHF